MIEIGTKGYRSPDGAIVEVILFDRAGDQLALIYGDACRTPRVLESTRTVPFCEVTLELGQQGLPVEQGQRVEIWVQMTEPGRKSLLFRGNCDYTRLTRKEDRGDVVLALQARGLAGALIDAPIRGAFNGTIADVVRAIASPIPTSVNHDDDGISVWVDAQSAYGALRLLAVTTDSVLNTPREGHLEFESFAASIERAFSKPIPTLDDEQMLAFEFTTGSPIKQTT